VKSITFSSIWYRFLNTIKQFLCLSLIKNTALSVMAIFQLQCSIFMMLLVKFRSGLKEEIGIFFPMLVLRVLENVNQPSFLQKMTVLNFVDKISQDSQIIVDIFINYDCDVDAPNLYERYYICICYYSCLSCNLYASVQVVVKLEWLNACKFSEDKDSVVCI